MADAAVGLVRPSDRAPGLALGDGVALLTDTEVGANVVIHAGTVIGSGVRIQDGAVIGKPVALGPHSEARPEQPPPARIGTGATIGAGAVLVAGADVGPGAVIGDQAHVRERAVIGAETVIGRGSAVDNDVTVGARVKVQTGCYLTARTVVEDDVFVAPGVTTTNDHTMGRHGPDHDLAGAVLRRACRVGGGAILLPAVEVGEEALVAAGAVVTRSVAARTVVAGVPARRLRDVPAEELLERWR